MSSELCTAANYTQYGPYSERGVSCRNLRGEMQETYSIDDPNEHHNNFDGQDGKVV